ncbi:MAG: preprotein translocase subunit SecE [Bacteroidia bacterium]
MSKIKTYFEETYNELVTKVSWPTWQELQSSAIVVMIASLIIALIIFIMDKSFSELMKIFYNSF